VPAPIFAKRYYCAVASIIAGDLACARTRVGSDAAGALVCLALSLADRFAADNPRFDRGRFYAACGLGPADAPTFYGTERDRLEARGYKDGHAAATWFAPQDERTARWILDGLDAGEPEVIDYLPAPRLGGEWADEPTWSNVLADEGCEDSDDGRPELLDAYQYAYSCAAERAVVRSCRAMLGLVPADLGTR
jgi:hypothetical protein